MSTYKSFLLLLLNLWKVTFVTFYRSPHQIVGTLFIYDRRYIHTWRDTEAANQSCSAKKVILRNFAKFTGKYLWWGPFERISRVTDYDFMIEKTLTQVFPFEFYESFQNSFFAEQLWVSTSHPGMFTGGLQI